jgi:DNA phosphorothioation-dependent restriction protein DptG
MRESLLNAVDTPAIIENIDRYLLNPYDYTVMETYNFMYEARMALEILSRADNGQIQG